MRKIINTWNTKEMPTALAIITKMNEFIKGKIVEFGTDNYALIVSDAAEERYMELLKASEQAVTTK